MPNDPGENPDIPLLAYVYHPRSFATLSLANAARGVCRVVWVVDSSNEEMASMQRLLRRFGETVDIAGLSADQAAKAIAAFGPDGILTLADDNIRQTAELAAHLGLSFHTPATALRLTDKYLQRAALADGGLIVPRSWTIAAEDFESTWEILVREARFPAVLKPRRGEGSRDTLPVDDLAQLRTLLEELRRGDGGSRDFVLEEYIGDAPTPLAGEGYAGYVSVESYVQDGHVTNLAVTGRMPPAYPFRETGFFIPSSLDARLTSDVLDVATRAVTSMTVTRGCFHTEIKLTSDGPVVIEVNGRIGGGVAEMLFAVTGVEFLKIAMRLALGVSVDVAAQPRTDGVAYLFYVQAPVEMCRVVAVDGLSDLERFEGVKEIVLNRGPGQNVHWKDGNHGHVFSVFGTTPDQDGVRRVDRAIKELVTIKGE